MRRLTAVILLIAALAGAVACATAKPPVVYLPKWEHLPAVPVTINDDGSVCMDPDAVAIAAQREALRDLREGTYLQMLESLGCVPPP